MTGTKNKNQTENHEPNKKAGTAPQFFLAGHSATVPAIYGGKQMQKLKRFFTSVFFGFVIGLITGYCFYIYQSKHWIIGG